MKIYVIRHGITQLNKKKIVNGQIDEPLAPEGIAQAKEAMPLIPTQITDIYTSPLMRARQTADIFNTTLHRPILVEPALTEIHMGTLAGHSWTEMAHGPELKIKHRSMHFDYHSYGGESVADVKRRVVTFLKTLHQKHTSLQALLVTHGGIIRLLHVLRGEQLLEDLDHLTLLTFDLGKIARSLPQS